MEKETSWQPFLQIKFTTNDYVLMNVRSGYVRACFVKPCQGRLIYQSNFIRLCIVQRLEKRVLQILGLQIESLGLKSPWVNTENKKHAYTLNMMTTITENPLKVDDAAQCSVVEHLPGMQKILGSIPSIIKIKTSEIVCAQLWIIHEKSLVLVVGTHQTVQ